MALAFLGRIFRAIFGVKEEDGKDTNSSDDSRDQFSSFASPPRHAPTSSSYSYRWEPDIRSNVRREPPASYTPPPPPRVVPQLKYKKVFRLLRDYEDFQYGISAKKPYANVSVDYHVAYGSKTSSQYISTSTNLYAIKKLVGLKIYGALHNIQIVKIDLVTMKIENPSTEIIDLTDAATARCLLTSSRARNFASNFDEVLIKGSIPKSAVQLIYKGSKNGIYDESNWIEYDYNW